MAPAGLFLLGYLSVWAAFGVAAALVHQAVPGPSWALGAVLLAAGLYQLTPPKSACLEHCRRGFDAPPVTRGGALRAGMEDGVYCMGSCWALMALSMAGGTAGLLVMAAVTVVVLAEKLAPRGLAFARAVGVLLVAAGALTLGGLTALAQSTPRGQAPRHGRGQPSNLPCSPPAWRSWRSTSPWSTRTAAPPAT